MNKRVVFVDDESIREEAGRHFDPAVYAAFVASAKELRAIRHELCDEIPCMAGMGCPP